MQVGLGCAEIKARRVEDETHTILTSGSLDAMLLELHDSLSFILSVSLW